VLLNYKPDIKIVDGYKLSFPFTEVDEEICGLLDLPAEAEGSGIYDTLEAAQAVVWGKDASSAVIEHWKDNVLQGRWVLEPRWVREL
jgi:hypothetical protein